MRLALRSGNNLPNCALHCLPVTNRALGISWLGFASRAAQNQLPLVVDFAEAALERLNLLD